MSRSGQRGIWAVVMMMSLVSCSSDHEPQRATPTGPPSTDVVVESQAIVSDIDPTSGLACFVRGTMHNVTRRTLHADVDFTVFDSRGKPIGSAGTGVDIKGGARVAYSALAVTRDFEGSLLCSRVASVQVATLVTCDLAAATRVRPGDSTSPVFCPLE